MHTQTNTLLMPGHYKFRANPFEPWKDVKVYRKFVENEEKLRAKLAGVEIDVAKIARHGEWESLSSS